MSKILQSVNEEIKQIKQLFEEDVDITLALIFGSYVKGKLSAESDIDIAIKLKKPLLESKKILIIQSIANITGRAVDLVDLQKVGEPLLNQIIKGGKVIKGSSQAYTELAIKNVYANEDFLPYIKRSLKARREKWIK